ncbi:Fic family protein [Pediococcus pentosaceus]|uniref:Fido domain-containing protein n=1 Tax=Pediococcus pentosaceus TaxID=1255 RepID=Q9XDL8_PEDPE|nr:MULTISPECIES: Fic family protein [Lactobacillaceae]AAD39623.2 unknown [Pediococcus pentosaceus]MBF7126202.1 Fic family protein [Pediococcus pentosaceus]WPK17591.1 Fic family protein [Pediococcus pentosaceus]
MTSSQQYVDIYSFTSEENRRFARSNFTKLVHTNARFEGINTTLPQTQTIMDGMSVAGVPVEDVLTIVNLKRGWQYVTTETAEMTLDIEKAINKIVAAEDALVPGELRQGQGGVNLGDEEFFEPPLINQQEEQTFLQKTLTNSHTTTTDKALTIMYHNMRQQIFWDGNKRTATLSANKIMIDGGAGLINVPLDKWAKWNELIADFYRTNDMQAVKEWTYQNGIQGLEVRKNK